MRSFVRKLDEVRSLMREKNLDFIIIPMSDPHLGENIPEYWQVIKWLTGFTGSAATLVISSSFAGLWTDSRYFIQAQKQLVGTGFQFVKPGLYQRNDYMDYLAENALRGNRIGFDGRIFSMSNFRRLQKRLVKNEVVFINDLDFPGDLWEERPAMPSSSAFEHLLEYSGKDRLAKIEEVRQAMEKQNADYHLLTWPEDINWLLNIRGKDLEYSPLLLSFALVGQDQVLLFAGEDKIPGRLAAEFDKLGIVILPYEEMTGIVASVTKGHSLLLDPRSTSVNLYNSLYPDTVIVEGQSLPTVLKAIKNTIEIENLHKVMIKDGVALIKFFHWFEENHGKILMTEKSLSEKLLEFRSMQDGFFSLSFPSIVAWNENSALPHYGRGDETGLEIGERGLLLVDSGGHYNGGTTDVTRTISVGIPTDQQKRDFTLILKGHINLALAKFPEGTRGYQLDFIARGAMCGSGMNYAHGTGHGVGYFLNVHEGPQSISPADNKTCFEAGMLTSNEPAIYREGEYGIRTENLILCYQDEETEFGRFLRFDTISLCYIEKGLVDKSLLCQKEIDWLNEYHLEVYENLSPFLDPEEQVWLREKTLPI